MGTTISAQNVEVGFYQSLLKKKNKKIDGWPVEIVESTISSCSCMHVLHAAVFRSKIDSRSYRNWGEREQAPQIFHIILASSPGPAAY